MIHLRAKFHISSSNGSLVIAIKRTDKCRLRILFYILHNITLTNVARFWKSYYQIKFQNPTLSGSNVAPTSSSYGRHVGISDGENDKGNGKLSWCLSKYHAMKT